MKLYKYPEDGDLKEIKIELTKECPLTCIHCSSNASLKNVMRLSYENALSIIEQAVGMNVKSIVFSGGEPLFWPNIIDVVDFCKKKGLNTALYTTGISRNGNGASEIIDLVQHGLEKVIFSLYSPLCSEHEAVTRKSGSYRLTIDVMNTLREINVEREIHFVPLKVNFHRLDELVRLALDNCISKVSILRFVPQGRGIILKHGREMLNEEETISLREALVDCRERYDIDIRVGSPYNILLLNEQIECVAARETLCISPYGKAYPCDAFKNIEPQDIGVTDIYHSVIDTSLRECWEKSGYLNAVRNYLSTPFENPCKNCYYLVRCKSGCLAQKVLEQESIENGNISKKPDPLCLKYFLGGHDVKH